MDIKKIEKGVRLILEGIGEDPERAGLKDTPTRVARMYEEIFSGLETPTEEILKHIEVQERLTAQLADLLMEKLKPKGAMVIIDAEHLCLSMRGLKKPGARTVTSAVRGIFRTKESTREELLELIKKRD